MRNKELDRTTLGLIFLLLATYSLSLLVGPYSDDFVLLVPAKTLSENFSLSNLFFSKDINDVWRPATIGLMAMFFRGGEFSFLLYNLFSLLAFFSLFYLLYHLLITLGYTRKFSLMTLFFVALNQSLANTIFNLDLTYHTISAAFYVSFLILYLKRYFLLAGLTVFLSLFFMSGNVIAVVFLTLLFLMEKDKRDWSAIPTFIFVAFYIYLREFVVVSVGGAERITLQPAVWIKNTLLLTYSTLTYVSSAWQFKYLFWKAAGLLIFGAVSLNLIRYLIKNWEDSKVRFLTYAIVSSYFPMFLLGHISEVYTFKLVLFFSPLVALSMKEVLFGKQTAISRAFLCGILGFLFISVISKGIYHYKNYLRMLEMKESILASYKPGEENCFSYSQEPLPAYSTLIMNDKQIIEPWYFREAIGLEAKYGKGCSNEIIID